ncbi:D-serine ammonia-lyase [Acidipropionibacterium thoenii]|uniref:D-serine ammonia-lyase n=1 Tax=Acidipropionibacterium thoenii TaxID=1751 RepID=UPI000403C991|nr:D-serine ammonia-lyase [Acidipropionibacterium thoenii]
MTPTHSRTPEDGLPADEMPADDLVHGRLLTDWIADHPLIADLIACRPTQWFNPDVRPAAEGLTQVGLSPDEITGAADRLDRFAPFLAAAFPQTRPTGGIIESPLAASSTDGVWLKLDSQLPISGSIKARGGIYQVLLHAETLAIEAGLLTPGQDYTVLAEPRVHRFFAEHSLSVASTGNLGLSIGIMSATLGFRTQVHMSADARGWKKEMLRSHGVEVIEYPADYSTAITAARTRAAEALAAGDRSGYFIDDENSSALFLGYAVAARRLSAQLRAMDRPVDADHPLIVYLPCGVGGGPGGIGFGLKVEFGDAVHLILAEPTHCPSMFLGVYTGLHSKVSVTDFGIDGRTAADGLACSRPSGFVGQAMQQLIDGYLTVDDDDLFRMLTTLHDQQGIDAEPSAVAGLAGIGRVRDDAGYRDRIGLDDATLSRATQIAWITGGSMVPAAEMAGYLQRGRGL